VLAEQGKVVEAEAAYRDLLTQAPDYPKIPSIVAKLAKHYQDASKEIQVKIDAVQTELIGTPEDRAKGVRAQRIAADKEEIQLVGRVSDLNQAVARLEAWFEFIKNTPEAKFGEDEKKKKELELAAKLEEQKKARAELAAVRAPDRHARPAPDVRHRKTALLLEQVPRCVARPSSTPARRDVEEVRHRQPAAKKCGSRTWRAYRYYCSRGTTPPPRRTSRRRATCSRSTSRRPR
jgi:hypothetical protein